MSSALDPRTALDLTTTHRIHVIGVGGAGMRAIASVLAAMGHTVSGSDLRESAGLDRLRAEGVEVVVGHSADNVGTVDLVTRSTAVPDHNPEVRAATERGVPVLSRADVLAAITRVRPTVAVAGTHGKTTTSSMLAVMLTDAGLDPSFIIGGELNEIGSGAVWADDDGGWFVVEADESDGTFLQLASSAAIVTSVEPDHLAHYGGEDELVAAFDDFVDSVSGPTVVCLDDPGSAALARHGDVITYGTDPAADVVITDYEGRRSTSTFTLTRDGSELARFELATPGLHNARNATAAVALALELGASVEDLVTAAARFAGVARRFQFRGEAEGVTYIDDYAHLPSEVEAAIATAADGGWGRIVCVFQPHRFSRTRDLWQDFAGSFTGADVLVVSGIYPSGETPLPGISGALVADAVSAADPTADVRYCEHRAELSTTVAAVLRPGDVCLTLGAGDLTTLADELLG